MTLTAGTALQDGKYVIQATIAQTDCFTVYQAIHAELNHAVLLRTLTVPDGKSELRTQFLTTAQRLAQCRHPHVIKVLDCFKELGLSFVVLEQVAGIPFQDWVLAQTPLRPASAIAYLQPLIKALSLMQEKGLCYDSDHPAQIVCQKGSDRLIVTGFPMLVASDSSPLSPVADMLQLSASLLYGLLTGQVAPTSSAEQTEQIHAQLDQLKPPLATPLKQAILQGLCPDKVTLPATLQDWFAPLAQQVAPPQPTLPVMPALPSPGPSCAIAPPPAGTNGSKPAALAETPRPTVVATLPQAPAAATAPQPPITPQPTKNHGVWVALGATAVIAALTGAGVGLGLRFEQLQLPNSNSADGGNDLFKSEQSFPRIQRWPGADLPGFEPPGIYIEGGSLDRNAPLEGPVEVAPDAAPDPIYPAAEPPVFEEPASGYGVEEAPLDPFPAEASPYLEERPVENVTPIPQEAPAPSTSDFRTGAPLEAAPVLPDPVPTEPLPLLDTNSVDL